jgi:pSer/pThr/pTyr-binding forkhead associated (FHA) protein
MGASLVLMISDPGSREPRRVEIQKEEVVIGKDPECDVVLSDPKVSRRHARISVARGALFLQDLKSTNGTYLNSQVVQGERKIGSDDVIRIVDYMIRVLASTVSDADKTFVDMRRPVLPASPPKPAERGTGPVAGAAATGRSSTAATLRETRGGGIDLQFLKDNPIYLAVGGLILVLLVVIFAML